MPEECQNKTRNSRNPSDHEIQELHVSTFLPVPSGIFFKTSVVIPAHLPSTAYEAFHSNERKGFHGKWEIR